MGRVNTALTIVVLAVALVPAPTWIPLSPRAFRTVYVMAFVVPAVYCTACLFVLRSVLANPVRKENRLYRLLNGMAKPGDSLSGKRIVVIGNGPSAKEGRKLGHVIDDFDE